MAISASVAASDDSVPLSVDTAIPPIARTTTMNATGTMYHSSQPLNIGPVPSGSAMLGSPFVRPDAATAARAAGGMAGCANDTPRAACRKRIPCARRVQTPLVDCLAVARRFSSLPRVPDHPRLEEAILELWERERMFEQLRERNRGGPRFSFIDGPVTANKGMGVHTAWGRTLKDVFQRYKALRGFDQRYQNGWDCQGLWIEVGVEKSLGLNSKHEIEEYGLERFAQSAARSSRGPRAS